MIAVRVDQHQADPGRHLDPDASWQCSADLLTGLPGRHDFVRSLNHALTSHSPLQVAVMVVDIDHFRFVNDTVGHRSGDALLASAAEVLRRLAPTAGCLARTAGDEFMLWTLVDRQSAAITLAERLRSALDRPFSVGDVDHFTSASVGLVVADETSTAHDLIAEADTAMSTAKAGGGNGYAVFDSTLRDRMHARAQALRELSRAIQHREIDLDVQPIIDLRDGTRSYEMLARWNHPTRGRLSPAAFIGLAEESGLIGRLGSQILELGASHAAALGARVSVNVSVRQFNRTLTQQVGALIDRYRLDRGQLVIEITESAVIDNGQAQSILDGLRTVGADIWIDDFGTGYSSLSRLTALTVDGLKLPREFVEDLDSPQGWGIASAIVAIARALGIDVIAEGVETLHQLHQLQRLGCDAAQGYLLARPHPFLQEQAAMMAGDPPAMRADVAAVLAQRLVNPPPPAGAPPGGDAEPATIVDETMSASVIGDVDDETAAAPGAQLALLWDHLPLGVLVVDRVGTIRLANERAAGMAGHTAEEVIGRSLFEFIPAEDAAFIAATIDRGTDFAHRLLGPFRLRYHGRDGTVAASEHWAYEAPAGLGFDGYVVTTTHESTGDLLAEAFRGIARGAELDDTLSSIARAMGPHPVEGTGAMLVVHDGHVDRIIGAWPYGAPYAHRDTSAPWCAVARGGGDVRVPVGELPPHLRAEPAAAGHTSVWLRAVDLDGSRRAVIAVWNEGSAMPSPNQERHLDEAVAAAALAFAQDSHRRWLRHAATHDHLTSAGNRVKLEQDATSMHAGFALFVDLDDFKRVNDRFGHAVGDLVLQTAAERVMQTVGDRGRLYRVGGDEFAVLFPAPFDRTLDETDADLAASEVLAALWAPYTITDTLEVVVGASVGTAVAGPGERADHLLSRADEALLWAKRDGKGRVQRALDVVPR
jgi:diguanylate cyclase (GGDEF)-like protein/PAS domain S-box-containing protein